jgi:hypothetical protein
LTKPLFFFKDFRYIVQNLGVRGVVWKSGIWP